MVAIGVGVLTILLGRSLAAVVEGFAFPVACVCFCVGCGCRCFAGVDAALAAGDSVPCWLVLATLFLMADTCEVGGAVGAGDGSGCSEAEVACGVVLLLLAWSCGKCACMDAQSDVVWGVSLCRGLGSVCCARCVLVSAIAG